jgi:hypothetical protein
MQMRFHHNQQHPTALMYLESIAYPSHHTNGKQQLGIYMSVFVCVSLWLIKIG